METTIDAAGGAGLSLTLTRHLAAPPDLVFRAWTEPRHLRRWSAPQGFAIPECDGDLRVGGTWHCTMVAPDGGAHRLRGTYREITPPTRLVYSHVWLDETGAPGPETLLTVNLEPEGAGTRLTIVQTGFGSVASRDGHEGGWSETLDRLGDFVAAVPADQGVIRIVREIAAPRRLVCAAWTDPAHIARWWGPHGFETSTTLWDFRPGGTWAHVMHGPDGRDYVSRLTFGEIVAPEQLRYSIAGEGETQDVRIENAVTLQETEIGTRVTMLMRFASVAERDRVAEKYGAVDGGHDTLERLAGIVADGSVKAEAPPVALVIERDLTAPRALVWKAWTDPGHLARWWGPEGFTNPVCEIDPAPDGALAIDMRAPDGTVYPCRGVVEAIEAPERLVMRSWVPNETGGKRFEVRQSITFAAIAGGTRLRLVVWVTEKSAGADEALAGMAEGWSQSLARLEAETEGTA